MQLGPQQDMQLLLSTTMTYIFFHQQPSQLNSSLYHPST
jgi:hypothetical protein